MPSLDQLYAARFAAPVPIPASLRPHSEDGHRRLRIEMTAVAAKLHPALPPTTLWTYNGTSPGPTIEVRSGETVTVEWANRIVGKMPVKVVHTVTSDTAPPQNEAGVDPAAVVDPRYGDLDAWTVVHLHGGRTAAVSDGWPDDVTESGRSVEYTYEFQGERSKMLWYHDHAMGVTRLNVMAGLAGLFLVRDQDDRNLLHAIHETRPWGYSGDVPDEIPLVIQDRNMDTDAAGNLTGQLLHKTEDLLPGADKGPMEFFGPLTVVNGAIWPFLSLDRLPYRVRAINGSNARTYRLNLVDAAGANYNSFVCQVGTDGGLLGAPVALPPGGLILAPAERADLVFDFGSLPAGVTTLRWVNDAAAPFGNTSADPATATADRLKYPDVMEFRVGARPAGASPLTLPNPLAAFTRLTHATIPHSHHHRMIALIETDRLELRELKTLASAPAPYDPARHLQLRRSVGGPVEYYEMLPAGFNDAVNIFVELGGTEVWRFLNLTADTHPMHVHLTQYQISDANGRGQYIVPADLLTAGGIVEPDPSVVSVIDDNEIGWKDTMRVNPGEMLSILAPFTGYPGRYVYHCHILEHEDHEMMRPFVVAPAALAMAMGMS